LATPPHFFNKIFLGVALNVFCYLREAQSVPKLKNPFGVCERPYLSRVREKSPFSRGEGGGKKGERNSL